MVPLYLALKAQYDETGQVITSSESLEAGTPFFALLYVAQRDGFGQSYRRVIRWDEFLAYVALVADFQ